jgi:hypothetical protein
MTSPDEPTDLAWQDWPDDEAVPAATEGPAAVDEVGEVGPAQPGASPTVRYLAVGAGVAGVLLLAWLPRVVRLLRLACRPD